MRRVAAATVTWAVGAAVAALSESCATGGSKDDSRSPSVSGCHRNPYLSFYEIKPPASAVAPIAPVGAVARHVVAVPEARMSAGTDLIDGVLGLGKFLQALPDELLPERFHSEHVASLSRGREQDSEMCIALAASIYPGEGFDSVHELVRRANPSRASQRTGDSTGFWLLTPDSCWQL